MPRSCASKGNNDFPTDLVRGHKFKSQKIEKDLERTKFSSKPDRTNPVWRILSI